MKVGRRVAFKVSKARVSFPRRESYGLEARFKVTTHLVLLQILLVGCWITFSFFTMSKLFLASCSSRCGWKARSWRRSEEPPSTELPRGDHLLNVMFTSSTLAMFMLQTRINSQFFRGGFYIVVGVRRLSK